MFSAVEQCPKCCAVAVHWLDEPQPKPTQADIIRWNEDWLKFQNDPGDALVSFGGGVVRYVGGYPRPRELRDESMFEVMRVCVACSHRWGIN